MFLDTQIDQLKYKIMNKTALVTGSNRGIGLATALTLAREGLKVFAGMRDPRSKSKDLLSFVSDESLAVEIVELDVDNEASVQRCFGVIGSSGEKVDVLINNAGIERRGSVEKCPISTFEQVMNTNYLGPIRCIQAALPAMKESGSGLIVNITSVAGKVATSPLAPYTASKFALEALSECLAQEVLPHGVKVAIIEPGIIATDMANNIARANYDPEYPQQKRMAAMFEESLKSPASTQIVADTITEIVVGKRGGLRHPVGPDAIPFLEWRESKSDSDWANWHNVTDEEWCKSLEKDFGMSVKLSD
tara:strand:+ start:569 stop:1483 length:915 start_codon:yes stop_codon:yes gene_type:complete